MFILHSSDGQSYPITREITSLGRSSENDIVINDNAISRHHLNFFIKNEQIIAEDAGSQNGFLYNGNPRREAIKLKEGDRLSFGRNVYIITSQNFNGVLDFKSKPNKKTAPKNFGSETIEIKGIPQFSNKRILIYGVLGLFILFIALDNGSSKFQATTLNKEEEALAPLPTDGYEEVRQAQPKTQSELIALSRYREAIRDYYNDNYAGAITGLQTALTLNPSNEEARAFLERAETQLKAQIEDLVFYADKAFRLMHYRHAKALSVKALNILTERTPGYIRKIAQENDGLVDNRANSSQEDTLSKLPCEQTQYVDFCKKASEILDRSRSALKEKDVLK
ncbi:FHA domain-containing protein [bacterium]|nr:FHA domain-containing protein [bacterium]